MIQRVTQVAQSASIQPGSNSDMEPLPTTNGVNSGEEKPTSQNKQKIADRFRGLIGSMFDE